MRLFLCAFHGVGGGLKVGRGRSLWFNPCANNACNFCTDSVKVHEWIIGCCVTSGGGAWGFGSSRGGCEWFCASLKTPAHDTPLKTLISDGDEFYPKNKD